LILVPACSDEGDSPTEPNGGSDVTLTVANATAVEGSDLSFQVLLNKTAATRVIFTYRTLDSTAVATEDYTAVGPTVDTIPSGAISMFIFVPTINDAAADSVERVKMVLSGITGAIFGDSVGIGSIIDDDEASFAGTVRPVLMARCAKVGCHAGSGASTGLALGSVTYNDVINATGTNTGGKVVVPGDASSSTLYTKTTDTPPFGGRMPGDGPPYLPIEDQNKIRDWINQGALNN
jgi:hypothetical protein